MKKILSFDFGGTLVKYALIEQNGTITERCEEPAPMESTEGFKNLIIKKTEEFRDQIEGIAVSMPGIINSDTGYVHIAGAYTRILHDIDLFDLLKEADLPIAVENDGNAAALAEKWLGTLMDTRSGVAVVLGSAVGGGIIIDDRLVRGTHFSAGEFSLLPSEAGNYDPRASLAYEAGMTALLLNTAKAKGMDPDLFETAKRAASVHTDDIPVYTGKDVFQWIEEGDPVTCHVYQEWLASLVRLLYSLKLVLDPDKIVIGGGVSRQPRLLNDIREEYKKTKAMTWASDLLPLDIEICRFTSDANLIGAVYNWLLHYGA